MLEVNQFFDINKFPKETGMLYWALSMPLLGSTQSPENCYNDAVDSIEKVLISNIGVYVVYTDNLYLCSPDEAYTLKRKHQKMVANHKSGWMNLIKKNIYIIPSAYTFTNWSQLLLDCNNFDHYLNKFKIIYDEDVMLQKYIQLDIENTGREVNTYAIAYMLEEILLDYMVMKGKVRMQNDYTNDKEQWILNCYHGKPHRSHVYLHQKNFFEFDNAKNIYQNSCYDMLNKKLYNYDNLDIETFDFSKNTISELSDKISE